MLFRDLSTHHQPGSHQDRHHHERWRVLMLMELAWMLSPLVNQVILTYVFCLYQAHGNLSNLEGFLKIAELCIHKIPQLFMIIVWNKVPDSISLKSHAKNTIMLELHAKASEFIGWLVVALPSGWATISLAHSRNTSWKRICQLWAAWHLLWNCGIFEDRDFAIHPPDNFPLRSFICRFDYLRRHIYDLSTNNNPCSLCANMMFCVGCS